MKPVRDTGLLFASITSGRIISKRGRYKVFPIIGTGVAVVCPAVPDFVDDEFLRELDDMLGDKYGIELPDRQLVTFDAPERRSERVSA